MENSITIETNLQKSVIKFMDEKLSSIKVKWTTIKMTQDQKNHFYAHCIYNHLDPYKWEVRPVPFYWDDWWAITPITNYKVFLQRAMKSWRFWGMKFENIYEDVTYKQFKTKTNPETGEVTDDLQNWAIITKKNRVWLKLTIIRTDRREPYTEEWVFEEKAKKTKEGVITKMRSDNKMMMLKKQLLREVIPMVFSDCMDMVEDLDLAPHAEYTNIEVADTELNNIKLELLESEPI